MSKCLVFMFLGLVSYLVSGLAQAADDELRAIAWPHSLLLPGEDLRIDDIRIVLDCGEFRAIKNIPSDWNAEIVRPVSEKSELHLSAGHGASDLAGMAALDRAIVVAGLTEKCFSLSITIMAQAMEKKLTVADVTLVKVTR